MDYAEPSSNCPMRFDCVMEVELVWPAFHAVVLYQFADRVLLLGLFDLHQFNV